MHEKTINNNDVLTFTFPPEAYSRLNWTLSEKEFRYRGKMYDIVSVKKVEGAIHISCKVDLRETRLRKFIDNFLEHSSRHNFPLQQWAGNFSHLFYPEIIRLLPPPSHFILLTRKPYIFHLHTFENSSEAPPP